MYDLLIRGGRVLCMDPAGSYFEDGYVAISGARIVAAGDAADLPPDARASQVIDARGCAVIPGLINCHTHMPMVYYRGLADDLPLDIWLREHIFPAEAATLSAAMVYEATLLAAAESIKCGTTCINDMYIFEREVARACVDSGLRAVVAEGVINFPTASARSWQQGLDLTRELAAEYAGHELISPAVAAHSPYTCSPDMLQAAHALACEQDCLYHIHLHETQREPEMIGWREGVESPTEGLARLGVLDARLIGAHGVWLGDSDIAALAHARCSVVHCPCSNLKLASGIAPVKRLLDAGVAVGLGTDSAASNNNLDMFEELHTAALLQKGALLDARALPALQALQLATSGAAAALKRDDIGMLAPGKLADLIVVDLSGLHHTPQRAGAAALAGSLVYNTHAADVRDSIINGRIVMQGRRLALTDEDALRRRAADFTAMHFPSRL